MNPTSSVALSHSAVPLVGHVLLAAILLDSGIGRRLAEAFHRLGNTVVISGRRLDRLKDTTAANPGMVAIELDTTDPASIARVAAELVERYPARNVLINNAGIMLVEDIDGAVDEELLGSTIATNLSGPIRMVAALADHLTTQQNAVIVNVTSILGFVPLISIAIYSATKAALHSYTQSQGYAFRSSGVQVVELASPWVRTELLNSTEAERAMPLDAFIEETTAQFASGVDEIFDGDAGEPLSRRAGLHRLIQRPRLERLNARLIRGTRPSLFNQ